MYHIGLTTGVLFQMNSGGLIAQVILYASANRLPVAVGGLRPMGGPQTAWDLVLSLATGLHVRQGITMIGPCGHRREIEVGRCKRGGSQGIRGKQAINVTDLSLVVMLLGLRRQWSLAGWHRIHHWLTNTHHIDEICLQSTLTRARIETETKEVHDMPRPHPHQRLKVPL